MDSKAITKIQSIVLVVIIFVAAVGGTVAYVLLSGQEVTEKVKIGLIDDLGSEGGRNNWQGLILAAEQINAEGGIMGKRVEVVGEDDDALSGGDAAKFNSALTRLLTYHNVDFVIGVAHSEGFMVQELIAEHKRIFFEISSNEDEYTQRVLDNYDRYKYYFRANFNATSIFQGMTDGLLLLREQTGFNKVGLIGEEAWTKEIIEGLNVVLPQLGFDVVYKGTVPFGIADFTSYFAVAESSGVEIMVPLIDMAAVSFVKEYHERQSPMVVSGGWLGNIVGGPNGWEITEGKCEYMSTAAYPITAGYPLTSKTLPDRQAYIDRWNEIPGQSGSAAYEILRYILPDAIKRAGTLEVDAVVEALETTSIETSNARNFVFTSSHDLMMGENPNDPGADYMLAIYFQWVNGKQVPVYPKKIMEEAGTTYQFPSWNGPWNE